MADGGGLKGSEKRRVAAMDFEGLTPNDVTSRAPIFEWCDPTELLIDDVYQRQLSPRSMTLIRKIIADWDWARFKPPVVAASPEGFEVIDGQHTAIAAASHPGVSQIPVMIVTADQVADRAASFIGHNRDRIAMTAIQVHRAGLVAGDHDALAVEAVAQKAGVRLPPYIPSHGHWEVGDCVAFNTLYALMTRRGGGATTRILKILRAADLSPITTWQILAVERVLFEPEYQPAIAAEALTAALMSFGEGMRAQADMAAAQYRVNRAKALAVLLYRKASAGRRKVA